MIRRALIAALLLLAPSAAGAQDLSALAAKAKGQSFTAAIAGEQAYIESVTEFGRKFKGAKEIEGAIKVYKEVEEK